MGEKGTIKITQGRENHEIPVFDPADVEYSAWRVNTPNGIGAVNLVDPSDADLDFIRVATPVGVKAVSTSVFTGFLVTNNSSSEVNDYYVVGEVTDSSAFDGAASDGSDVTVLDQNGDDVNRHIIEWDASSNYGRVMFRVDGLAAGASREYELDWGDTTPVQDVEAFNTNYWTLDSYNSRPLPDVTFDEYTVQGWANGSNGRSYGNDYNRITWDNEIATYDTGVEIEFDLIWDNFTLNTSYEDRSHRFFRLHDSNNDDIFILWRDGHSGNDLQITEDTGDYNDIRSNMTHLRGLSTGTWYHFRIVYNESGNSEWKIYVNGNLEHTVGSIKNAANQNDPMNTYRFSGNCTTDYDDGNDGDLTMRISPIQHRVFYKYQDEDVTIE